MVDTLLISNSSPGGQNVGSILVRDMLDVVGADDISFLHLSSNVDAVEDYQVRFEAQCRVRSPHEHARRAHPGWRGSFATLQDRVFRYRREITACASDAQRFLTKVQPHRVWAILSSTAAIDLLSRLKPQLPDELLLQIWDDPLHLLRQRRLDRITRRRTLKRFRNLLARATRVAVISEPMAEVYSQWTSAELTIVRHGIDATVVPQSMPSSETEFRIGFTGGLYAHSAWRALQKGLDLLDWQLDGRQVVLVVAGSKVEFRSSAPAACRYLGWRSTEEVASILTNCDLLYVPQPFDAVQAPLARLSFPTKLSAYVSVGRPVLVHTPSHGSLVRFCKDHDFGMLCTSLEPAEVAATLRKLDVDSNLYSTLADSSARIGTEVLSRERFEEAVRLFVTGQQSSAPGETISAELSQHVLASPA